MRRTLLLIALCACGPRASIDGLAPAHDAGGPHVVFDLYRKPLPEIPFPSDIATRPDPQSPTGLRLNASLVAPSQLEGHVRALLDTLDGFGTFAPITVAFDKDLDVLDLYNRQNDGDPTNDGAYLVDLQSGALSPLDFDGGHFPYTLNDPGQYFLDDPDMGAFNLLFPVSGPLANFLHPGLPHTTVRQQADDLLTFYERSTRTLILRPVLPLAQERRYAVLLTNRIHGLDGAPISSPHAGINHALQTGELRPVLAHLPPGTALPDLAYAWAFTTQSVTTDLENIRNGLYGRGQMQLLNLQYGVQQVSTSTQYSSNLAVLQERGTYDPKLPSGNAADYVLPVNECAAPPAPPGCLSALLRDPQLQQMLVGGDAAQVQALLDTFRYVDYLVTGQYVSPSFLDGVSGARQDQTFRLDPVTGTARVVPATVTFTLAVPKPRPEVGHLAPFPTVIAGHGYESARIEHILGFSGTLAKFGLATISIDAYGHGIALDPLLQALAIAKAHQFGLDAFAAATFQGRARDLDNDGIPDSGGDFWTADTFHTRDVVRQSVVDWMQLVRLLATFDGTGSMSYAGHLFRAGDFNNDGVPDVAGPKTWPQTVFAPDGYTHLFEKGAANPGSSLFVFGVSLGGILSAILPAVEPAIAAAAPTSAAGGLADVALRSSLGDVVRSVFLEIFGPFFATCQFDFSAGAVDPQTTMPYGACSAAGGGTTPMLVLVVQDLTHERDIPIAPLALQPGDRVMARNLTQAPPGANCLSGPPVEGCSVGIADAQGRLRLPIGADWPSLSVTETPRGTGVVPLVQVTVLAPGDALDVTIVPAAGGPARVIDTFQESSRFYGVEYAAGQPLTSPARGFGYARNTPAFRRLMGLSQLILEPGDPIGYAPHYFHDLLSARGAPDPDTNKVAGPADVLVIGTTGDPDVPVSTAIALARAAGLVELAQPDPSFGLPIDQVLIRGGVVEGVPATDRFDDRDGGVYAALPGHVECDAGAACGGNVLIDPTGYSCDGGVCADGLFAPRLVPPLRQQLVRVSDPAQATCTVSSRQRAPGCFSTGASSCASGPGLSALLLPYLNRTGQHGFRNPQPGKPFDLDQFMANVVGRFFECRGRELRFDACQQDLSSCPWIPPPP